MGWQIACEPRLIYSRGEYFPMIISKYVSFAIVYEKRNGGDDLKSRGWRLAAWSRRYIDSRL